jgi:hypothetical protein
VLNTKENKPNIILTLITDVALLLVVLIGLLRLLHGSGGSFALGRLIWNQVGWGRFLFAAVLSVQRLIIVS